MGVHMIRVIASRNGMTLTEINDALDTWVDNHSEWVEDPVNHHITEEKTDSGTVYYGGNYRFHTTDAKDNLLTKCGDKLKNKVEWYRLGYHSCDHNESDRQSCSWDDEREWSNSNSSIPSDAPDFL